MKINRKYISAVFLLISLFSCIMLAGCDQEALFWAIAHELPPITPIIGGHPSVIVRMDSTNTLYVSNDIGIWYWQYNSITVPEIVIPNWNPMEHQPPSRIRDLAVVGNRLFALGSNGIVYAGNGTTWEPDPITGPGNVQRIFGAGTYLFAGTFDGIENYAIWSMAGTGTALIELQSVDGLLRGAAYNGTNYILGTQGGGVYTGSGISISRDDTFPDSTIMGITSVGSTIYMVTPGAVYQYGPPHIHIGSGHRFTGAISAWNHSGQSLLLLGIQEGSGSYSYGYREIQISPTGSFKMPGTSDPTSMAIGSGISSAIRSRAVNHLYVMPQFHSTGDDDHRPIIFAATQRNGVWSYRVRNGIAQWNGENNR